MVEVLIDCYTEDHYVTEVVIHSNHPSLPLEGLPSAGGQTFFTPDNGKRYRIKRAVFYLYQDFNPDGILKACLYEIDEESKPVGEPLAISDSLDITTITGSPVLYSFNFPTKYLMLSNHKYAIFVIALENTNFDINCGVVVATDAPMSHAGDTLVHVNGAWVVTVGMDTIFYVYGEEEEEEEENGNGEENGKEEIILKSCGCCIDLYVVNDICLSCGYDNSMTNKHKEI